MNYRNLLGTLLLLLTAFAARGQVVTENFRLGGPCMQACGPARLDSILRTMRGVRGWKYDATSRFLTIAYDEMNLSLVDIKLDLAALGYDAGEFRASMNPAFCCPPPEPKTEPLMRGEEEGSTEEQSAMPDTEAEETVDPDEDAGIWEVEEEEEAEEPEDLPEEEEIPEEEATEELPEDDSPEVKPATPPQKPTPPRF